MAFEASDELKFCVDDEDDLPLSAILPQKISCLRKCSNETVKKRPPCNSFHYSVKKSKVEDNVVDDEESDILISRLFKRKRKLADKSFSKIKIKQKIRVVSFKIAECSKELRIKEKEMEELKELVGGQAKKLESMKKQFEDQVTEHESKVKHFEERVKELEFRQNKFEWGMKEFETQKKVFEGLVKEFESKEREFQGQKQELESEKMCFESRLKEFESKEKQLAGRLKEFETKKGGFEGKVMEYESNEEEFECQKKELKSKRMHFESRVKELESKDNQLEGESDEIESFDNHILDNLLATSDPSKVVLEIIQNPIIPQCRKGHSTVTINGGHITLLVQLMRITPDIKPHVREEAMKLALDLKAHMSENSQAVLGFLLILSIYGLVPSFNKDEVLKLFGFVAQHKIAAELFETLGFADKISDFVQNLIREEKHIAAVRFICAYDLIDKYQPFNLLQEHMKNAKLISESSCKKTNSIEIKDKARDEEIAFLKTVLDCISDNNLQSESLLNEIQFRIFELIRQKGK